MEKKKPEQIFKLYGWGLGKYGAIGNGSKDDGSLVPNAAMVPVGVFPVAISAGRYFSAFINSNRDLYTFGNNGYSRAGHPLPVGESITVPRLVPGIKNVIKVSCGDWHMLAIAVDSADHLPKCYSVGFNKYGELGLGHTTLMEHFTPVEKVGTITEISAGKHVSFFIDDKKKLLSCGIGSLHGNASAENQLLPIIVAKLADKNILYVSAGYAHNGAVDDQGALYTWGIGAHLQLGHGTINPEKQPRVVEVLAGKVIKAVSCTRSDKCCHTGCIDSEGNVYTWGSGAKGKLGHTTDKLKPKYDSEMYPRQVKFFAGTKVTELICAGLHTAALTEDGKLYTFGCGSDGRLGHPECEGHRYLYKEQIPRIIDAFKGSKVYAVASSYYHMLALVQK